MTWHASLACSLLRKLVVVISTWITLSQLSLISQSRITHPECFSPGTSDNRKRWCSKAWYFMAASAPTPAKHRAMDPKAGCIWKGDPVNSLYKANKWNRILSTLDSPCLTLLWQSIPPSPNTLTSSWALGESTAERQYTLGRSLQVFAWRARLPRAPITPVRGRPLHRMLTRHGAPDPCDRNIHTNGREARKWVCH